MNDELAALKQQAWSLYESGQLDRASALCRRICTADSNDTSIWCLSAAIHGQSRRYTDARDCAEKAIQIDAANDGAWSLLGDICRALREEDRAVDAYRNALKVNPENTHVRCSLCNAHIYRHELDEARSVIEWVQDYAPEHLEAGRYLAVLDRRQGNLDLAKSRFARLLEQKLPARTRIAVLEEMGKLLEQCGEYAGSFRHYQAAQQAYLEEYAQKIKGGAIFDSIYRQQGALAADCPASWPKFKPRDFSKAPIFLVGFPRSGTTLLEQILASHSAIVASAEANILNAVIDAIPAGADGRQYPYNLHQLDAGSIRVLRAAYMGQANSLVRSKPGAVYFLDKLPFNIIHLPFIARLFPDACVIFALRDPRDVCLSCYTNVFDVNPAMINFSDMQNTVKLYSIIMLLWEQYRSKLSLATITVRYEDIVRDTESEARRVVGFLDLDWEDNMLKFYEKQNRRFIDTPSYEAVARPVYNKSVGRWRNYREFIMPMLASLEPYVAKFDYE